MEHPKLIAILEANIDTYWRELRACEFDELLGELESGAKITLAERLSLLRRLRLKKTLQGT